MAKFPTFAAIKSGVRAAHAPWVTFLPCDGQLPPETVGILRGEQARTGADGETVAAWYQRVRPAAAALVDLGTQVCRGLAAAHAKGALQFFSDDAALHDPDAFSAFLKPLRRIEWVVYAKRPFAGPAAVLAYLSDMLLIDTALVPHGTSVFSHAMQGASLDHAIWFHRPQRADDWQLHDFSAHGLRGGRGLSIGQVFTTGGLHVASMVQEVLVREKR